MASALVVRASAGTMTNPDQRQRLIENQAASKTPLALPNADGAPLPNSARQQNSPTPQSGLPILDAEVGFTTSLLAQRLSGDRRKYAPLARPTRADPPQTRLRDFLV